MIELFAILAGSCLGLAFGRYFWSNDIAEKFEDAILGLAWRKPRG
jgi:hypothetical protein